MLTIKAPAKINLGLRILRKLPTGYHEVETIYSQVSLFDTLHFETLDTKTIIVKSNDKSIPTGADNVVYQAADVIRKEAGVHKGVSIYIHKNIPAGAALGGGSSDAATTLKVLNQLWQLKLHQQKLLDLAKKIGADVPYFFVGGTQVEFQGGKQAGKFTSLKKLPLCSIVLCVPNIFISSQKAYQEIEYDNIGKRTLLPLIKAINDGDLKSIGQHLYDDFETWTLKKHPVIAEIKKQMIQCGALGSLMSGKGSAVFGIFDNLSKAKFVIQSLKNQHAKTMIVTPL